MQEASFMISCPESRFSGTAPIIVTEVLFVQSRPTYCLTMPGWNRALIDG